MTEGDSDYNSDCFTQTRTDILDLQKRVCKVLEESFGLQISANTHGRVVRTRYNTPASSRSLKRRRSSTLSYGSESEQESTKEEQLTMMTIWENFSDEEDNSDKQKQIKQTLRSQKQKIGRKHSSRDLIKKRNSHGRINIGPPAGVRSPGGKVVTPDRINRLSDTDYTDDR
eukprot:UN31865